MQWGEFTTLLAGLNGETPLGHIVSIRSETDRERLKHFTKEERKIRNDWHTKHRKIVFDTSERDKALMQFHAVFKSLSEKGG